MKPFILISERRTASTFLCYNLAEYCRMEHEKLCGKGLSTEEFKNWLPTSWDDCDGWNLMDYQLGYDSQWIFLGDYCREHDIGIIRLTRLNVFDQFKSLEKAMRTGWWNFHYQADPVDERYIPSFQEYLDFSNYQLRRFERCMGGINRYIRFHFEELINEEFGEIDRIKEFISAG